LTVVVNEKRELFMKMKLLQLLLLLFLNLISFEISFAQGSSTEPVNDGPYIFYVSGKLKAEWINKSVLSGDRINAEDFPELKAKFNLLFSFKDLTDNFTVKPNFSQSFENVDSVSVISDIHGEYTTYINLLKASGVIDNNLNWKYGKGHLVILGDIFDRGDMVTEVFWHLFGLEKQALEAGGMVHVLLGNHELLTLGKDLRYMNDKYKKVETIAATKYFDLYSENSVIGKWLRTKPIVITIDNILFVHGGLSIEMVRRNIKIRKINETFTNRIVGADMETVCADEELFFLSDSFGPLWYRGYFNDRTFCESRLDSILGFYKSNYIVVGHTSSKDIKSLFNTKVFAIDAGIMNEQPGEMLIYKNGSFYKCYLNGDRVKL
jgi:hypothetical protein